MPGRSRAGRRITGTLLLLAVLVVAAIVWLMRVAPVEGGAYPAERAAVVERVVDGDTIVVDLDGVTERVRLLNIDTPETVAPGRPVECLGPEASAFLESRLTPGAEVTLEFDHDLRDRYDRLLAGVVDADGTLVNAEIAGAGLAEPLVVGGNDRFIDEVESAVAEAQDAEAGLWAPGACG